MTDISSIDNYDDAITYINSSDFTSLDSATKVTQIEQLVNQLPTAADGQTVLGYSGTINIQGTDPLNSFQIAEPVGAESSGTIMTFDQTAAAQFLTSADVKSALNGIYSNPSDVTAFNSTMTGEISANLAASSTGSVKTVTGFMEDTFSGQTGGVSDSSVYFQTELPAWLKGDATTINGIPRETLVDHFESLSGHSISTLDLGNSGDLDALKAVQNDLIAPKSINDVMMGLQIPVDSSGNPVVDDVTGQLQSVGVGDTYIADVADGVTHDLGSGLTGSHLGSVIDLSNAEIGGLVDGAGALNAAGVSAPVLDLVQASSQAHTDLTSGDLSTAGHDLAQILGEITNGGTPAGESEVGNLAGRLALLVGEGVAETLGAVLAAASGVSAVAGLAGIEIAVGEHLGLIDPVSVGNLLTDYTWAVTNPSDVLKEAGMEIGDAFHSLGSAISSALDQFGEAQTEASPLVIDLSTGHTGITLTAFDAATTATFYDLDRTGFAEQTAWTSGDTGFLVQQNIDGSVNLFGTSTIDGFAELAKLDLNHDLKIDSADSDWGSLKVWLDSNGNGVVDSGELQSLSALDIASIDLAGVTPSTAVIDGNPISHTSVLTFSDGSTTQIADAWFEHSTTNTVLNGDYNLDLGTLLLPDLRGYGTISDLDVAMSQDSTLKSLVSDFAGGFSLASFDDPTTLDSDVTNILYQWAGVESVDPSSRAQNVNAQDLEFLEHLFGQNYNQYGSPDPLTFAGKIVETVWHEMLDSFKADLILQAGGSSLFSGAVTYDPWAGTVSSDAHLSQTGIENLATYAPGTDAPAQAFWVSVADFIDNTEGITNLTTDEQTWLDTAVTSTTTVSWDDIVNSYDHLNPGLSIDGTSGNDSLTGGNGDDVIYGNGGTDIIHGGAGNDTITDGSSSASTIYGDDGDDLIWGSTVAETLYGGNGNDEIHGGGGNDTFYAGAGGNFLYGGSGNDTFVYGGGDDVITTNGGTDQIILPSGITSGDLSFTRVSSGGSTSQFNDLLINFAGGGSIEIVGHFLGSGYQVPTIVFSDSSTLDLTTLTGYATVLTNGDDYYSPGLNIDQAVYGQSGSDDIVTGSGNDTLDGGTGNDLLQGGSGNDTYLASPGFDKISDTGGTDVIQIQSGYSIDDVTLSRHIGTYGPDSDLIIDIRGLGEIQVENQFYSSTYAVESLYFVDGSSTVSLADQTIQTIGTSGNDALYGITSGVAGNWFDGRGGNDYISNGIGDNTYIFALGFGTDTVSSTYHAGSNSLEFTGIDPSHIRMWTDGYGGLHLQDTTDTSHSITISAATTGSGTDETAIGSYLQQISFDDSGHTTWDLTGGLTLTGDNSGDYLYGTAYGDIIVGGTGADNISGNGGGDTLISGGGADYLTGGTGNDTYSFASGFGSSTVNDNGASASNIIHLTGIDPSDIRMWTDTSGYLHLQDTSDTSHNITVYAGTTGSGNYESTVGTYFSQVTFDSSYSTTWDLTGGLHITGDNSGDSLYGTAYGDTITGGTGADAIYGNGGADTLISGGGADYLTGGSGNDTYVFASGFGTSSVSDNSGAGANVIHFTGIDPADIRMWTDTGGSLHLQDMTDTSHSITVSAGTTGSGYYESTVGSYFSEVTFDSGYSTTWDLTSGLTLTGTSGSESLYGTAGNDTINGMDGGDTLIGNAGNDLVNGGSSADTLLGGDGNDILYGGGGNDYLTGNAGADTFLFKGATAETGVSIIWDFNTSQGDKIDLADVVSGYDPLTMAIANFVQLGTSGANTTVSVDTDGTGTSYTQIATLASVTGLNLTDLITDGNLIVHHT